MKLKVLLFCALLMSGTSLFAQIRVAEETVFSVNGWWILVGTVIGIFIMAGKASQTRRI